ncbi:hypothetical protein V6N11_057951 [Hibiscus sabdariffa]|uniref:CCHC-type domain-containing protein n=1 Tax=Hibiscus sabdariffa TaxID=183260 RepID=A0ABR2P415_9ROSI
MIKLFFTLGADQSLKQVILASIPELLENAVDRNLQQRRRNILQLTVGEIQQETFIALEELCDRRKIIKDYMSGIKELDKECKIPGLTIKCKKEHQCHYRPRGNKAFSRSYKRRSSKIPNFPVFPKRQRKWKYLRKKRVPCIKSSKCFLCGQKGHFAKSFPKNKKGSKMIQQIQEKTGIQILEDDDMESIFSIEDEPSDQSLFAIQRLEDEQEDPATEWSSKEGIYMM